MSNDERPLGQLFSAVYAEAAEPVQDNERLRRRLALAVFDAAGGNRQHANTFALSKKIERRFGIPAPHNSVNSDYDGAWVKFFSRLTLEDMLDILTVVATSPELVQRDPFIQHVERVFRESNAAFEMDARGGVHPRIDLGFAMQRSAAVAGLNSPEFAAAREYLDECVKALRQSPPDGAEAIRDIFLAAENVFRQMFPDQPRLTQGGASNRLRPKIKELYPEGSPEQSPLLEAASSFGSWVQASHGYRHEQPQPNVNQPPEELSILLVTQGFSFLRWLAHLHKLQRSNHAAKNDE